MTFEIGTIVMAKLKGFPWWPGTVENYNELPKNIIEQKPKGQKLIAIKFFGSTNYGWIVEGDLKLFTKNDAKDKLEQIKKHSTLAKAIRQALEHLSKKDKLSSGKNERNNNDGVVAYTKDINQKSKKRLRNDLSDDEKKVDNENKNDIVKHKYKGRNNIELSTAYEDDTSIRRSVSVQKVKKNEKTGEKLEETGNFLINEETITTTTTIINKNQKGLSSKSADKKDKGKTYSNIDKQDVMKKEVEKDKSPEIKYLVGDDEKLIHLRHKLQELVLQDEIDEVESKIIDEAIKEIENSSITIKMLKKSKMGILMRMISEKSINNDQYNIVERSQNLVNKWKMLLTQFLEENLSFEDKESQKEASSCSGNLASSH